MDVTAHRFRVSPPLWERGGAGGGVSLSQAVNPPPSFALIGAKVPLRGTCCLACCDQAAHIFDVLAWSFEQNRIYDPLCIFDAKVETRNRRRVILNEGGRLPSPSREGLGVGFKPPAERDWSTRHQHGMVAGKLGAVLSCQVLKRINFWRERTVPNSPLPASGIFNFRKSVIFAC